MRMSQDFVEIMVLPDGAKCLADEEYRDPFDIEECPLGYEVCFGDCSYYNEEHVVVKHFCNTCG